MTSMNDSMKSGTNHAKTSLLGRVVSGVGGMMRAVAGVPAGVRRDRRGTFLVMVIGTLALLAVIAVAHFAIGQADRRASGAVLRSDAKGDIPNQVSSYIKQVISDDIFVKRSEETNALLTGLSPAEQGNRAILRRNASDIPLTEWRADSTFITRYLDVNGYVDDPRYFSVTGKWSDSWLASTEATWVQPFPWVSPLQAHTDPTKPYMDSKDWAHISNIAPDGRFVNLWNLRNNFDAESGFGTGANGKPRTSANLYLIDPSNGGLTQATDYGVQVGNTTLPSFFANRQRGMFMPASADFHKINAQYVVGAATYHPYMFADVDGSGFFNGRWAELVDARDVNNPISALASDGSKRWFIAARIIDLSGLVNVNTSTDSSQGPGAGFPVGISPADIDLKRLLCMQDVYAANNPTNAGGVKVGYDGMAQSAAAPAGDNYSTYDKAMALRVGGKAYDALMRVRMNNEMSPALPEVAVWQWPTTLWNGVAVPATQVGVDRWMGWRDYASSISGAAFYLNTPQNTSRLASWFTIADLGELLSRHGVNDIEVTTRLERAMGGRHAPDRAETSRFSPERDNRGEELETDRLDATETKASEAAMIAVSADVRRQQTTVSGSRPLWSAPGAGADILRADVDVQLNISDLFRTNTVTSAANIKSIFEKVFVNSLAPALRLPYAWSYPVGGPSTEFEKRKTLFYGHSGPELGLFASAFMTANLVDALKPLGSEMGKYTLVFDSSTAQELYRNQPAGGGFAYTTYKNADGLPAFPWFKQFSDQTQPFCLDASISPQEVSRLAVTRATSSPTRTPMYGDKLSVPPAVNVFGMRAQPFITEIGCYTMMTDAPRGGGGDVDTVPSQIGQPPSRGITLNGDITVNNADFLVRVLAFQITNPFDEPVTLSSQSSPQIALHAPNTDAAYYYITIQNDPAANVPATLAVKLVSVLHAGAQVSLTPITIPAGQTIVCYTMSQSREDVVARINAVAPGGSGGDVILQGWLDKQLRAGAAGPNQINQLYEVPRIDPVAHASYITAFDVLAKGAIAGELPSLSVQLRKSERLNAASLDPVNLAIDETTPVTTVNGVAVYPVNRLGDDRLMDRFSLGTLAAPLILDRRLLGGNPRISGTFAGPQILTPHIPNMNSNSGITLTLWATAKRPTDPNAVAGAANIAAAIPLGGIPAYCIEPKSWATNWNERKTDALDLPATNLITLTGAMLDADVDDAAYEFATWQTRQVNGLPLSPTMCTAPWAQNTADGRIIPSNREVIPAPYVGIRQTMLATATANNGLGLSRSFTTMLPGQQPADIPAATLRATDMLLPMCVGPWEAPVDHDSVPQANGMIRWTTLAEAWAIAMGYEDLDPTTNASMTTSNPLSMYANAKAAVQSRGSQNPRPVTDYGHLVLDDFVPFYDDNANGRFDPSAQIIGTAHDMRFGLGIPAALSILDSITSSEATFGGLSRATPGVINLNTATHQALNCLPLLTPPDAVLLWTPAAGGFPPMDIRADVAASVLAYRDKTPVDVLPGRGNGVTQARFVDTDIVDGVVDTVVTPDQVGLYSGRARKNRIDGVREVAGFASPGEVMCVLSRDPAAFGANRATRDRVTNIDHLAFNTRNDSQAGIASLLRKDSAGNLLPDALKDKYEEKLMIAAALSNTTSVRSDVFACWFVIRGYGRDDCEGLGIADPMVPSVERRFLMVLDRSNITRAGDEPKVLVFQELPVK